MNKLKKSIDHFVTYFGCMFACAIGGIIGLSFLVWSIYRISHPPGQMMSGHNCGRGMAIGLAAFLGGLIGGAGLGAYLASKVLHSAELRAAIGTEWAYSFARRRSIATHLICAGAVVIGFSALSSAEMFLLISSIGLAFALVGAVIFVWSHFAGRN